MSNEYQPFQETCTVLFLVKLTKGKILGLASFLIRSQNATLGSQRLQLNNKNDRANY